ncbi:MAG: MCE family protein [Chrysiogenetes bacterium]|nr:MCE family protein [Chrysiogenetes bacterium]
MDDQTKTNVMVGGFAMLVLAIIAYSAVHLGPTGFGGGQEYRSLVVYVPSAAGLFEESPVRVAGVQVGLIDKISLERGQARVEVRVRADLEMHENARAMVKSSGLLGDRYIEIDPGTPEGVLQEQAGPPDEKKPRIIYADESGDIESFTQDLGRTGKNLEAITDNLRAVLDNRPGGNPELAQTLKALAELTTNLAQISIENRQDLRELVSHLRNISATLDRETPALAGEVRQLVRELNGVVSDGRVDVSATLSSFRESSERFNRSLEHVEEITRKIDEGEGTVGRLINDDETVEELNKAISGINNMLSYADRLELKLGYRAEIQPRVDDAKSVVVFELWPKPDKYFFVHVVSDPRGSRPDTVHSTITNTVYDKNGLELVGNAYFPATVNQSVTTNSQQGLKFSVGIGKRFDYFSVFGGLIENSGGFGFSVSPDRYEHFDLEVTAYDFDRPNDERPNVKARLSVNFLKYFYLTGGVEDMMAKNSDDVAPFFGGGILFVEDDLKPLLTSGAVPVP